MGSTLPFVETRLRMGPRRTVVARTFRGVWRRDEYSISRMRTTADASQTHRRRDGGCELFVDANLFSFRVRQELLYGVIYHSRGPTRHGQPVRDGNRLDAAGIGSAASVTPIQCSPIQLENA